MLQMITAAALTDSELLEATERVAADERRLTAELLALLGELDVRRLYLGQSCASLFTFCTHVLHFSEHAAYHRIEAARAVREFPVILDMVMDGALTLTTVALLRPHLTTDNHAAVLNAAHYQTKRAVEQQIACFAPQPDERTTLRRLPSPASSARVNPSQSPTLLSLPAVGALPPSEPSIAHTTIRPAVLEPLSPERFVLKVTLSADVHDKLRRAQDLMRHTIPNGDPARVLDRALTLLLRDLERTKIAITASPTVVSGTEHPSSTRRRRSRRVPAAVRRSVWARDNGRCAFVGAHGRCTETSRLEFHHVIPFADGGGTSVENLALRCRAHNQYESELWSPRTASGPE